MTTTTRLQVTCYRCSGVVKPNNPTAAGLMQAALSQGKTLKMMCDECRRENWRDDEKNQWEWRAKQT